jgi:hypothetical protein
MFYRIGSLGLEWKPDFCQNNQGYSVGLGKTWYCIGRHHHWAGKGFMLLAQPGV